MSDHHTLQNAPLTPSRKSLVLTLPFPRPTKARDFEGAGGPEDKARLAQENRGGDDDIKQNVRQGGETVRP